jgi:DNA polymerase-3 subunit alpha
MDPKDFVHLHVHSHYSLLEALPKPKALIARAKEQGMKALALTDNGAMYGAVEFYKAAKEAEIKPIIGLDAYIASHRMTEKRARIDERSARLVLIALNETGYRNLIKITTAGFLEGFYYKPRVDKEFLSEHADGLVALSGAVSGEIPAALLQGDHEKAKTLLTRYQEIFGVDNFYLELIHHPDWGRQEEANTLIKELARQTGAPLVVTKNIFYLNPEDREGYEAQQCIARGRTLEEFRQTNAEDVDLSFGAPEEICAAFADVPEALLNTKRIADRVEFQLEIGQNFLPIFPLPEGKSDNDYLHELSLSGLRKRYGELTPEINERFEYEYGVMSRMGFASYFIIVQDFINWAKANGVLVGPGRGSAAGSIIAYALGITDLDPLKYGLLFERFLNPDRVSMPDIDTDFSDKDRAKVMEYVTAKYGVDHVAGIITFGTMMPRAAVRDAARVLGLSFGEADLIAKCVPPPVQGKHTPLKIAIAEHPELREIYQGNAMSRRVIDLAMKMEGNPRHASQHACGIVIGDVPLVNRAPLQAGQREDMALVTQYSLNSAEAVGLVKMDFLGLSNLTVIQDALDIIEAVYGDQIDISAIPLDDQKTFDLLSRGDTTGVFQLESDGMKRYIRELKPSAVEDIIAMVALYRPGPMQFIDSYIRRKHGKERVSYEHPLMENAFRETYGIPVYQEQVMQISKDLAGFTGGEADTLRKAMGKKIAELMEKMEAKFIDGAIKKGVPEKVAAAIFQKLEDFAAYGFNKSHAACYAIIAYRTGYLKAHYPAAFMAALMNSDLGTLDRITIEVEECKRLGIKVLPPDVNESFPGFAVVKGTGNIRWGLTAVKNVGEEIAREIVRERKANGPFADLADFVTRIASSHFNKKSLEALVCAGALDRFGNRSTLYANLDQLLLFNKQTQKDLAQNQVSMFDLSPQMASSKLTLRTAQPLPPSTLLSWERELLGIYVSSHPADTFSEQVAPFVAGCADVREKEDEAPITVCGVVMDVKKILTKKKQEPMAFVRLEDRSGQAELVIFPKLFSKVGAMLTVGTMMIVAGKVSVREREGSDQIDRAILVDKLITFTDVQVDALVSMLTQGTWYEDGFESAAETSVTATPETDAVSIIIPEKPSHELIVQLRAIFQTAPGAQRVYLLVESGGGQRKVATEYSVHRTNMLLEQIAALVGAANVF